MKLVALAAIVAALAVPSALRGDADADRHRRPRVHDHAHAGRQEGDEAQGRRSTSFKIADKSNDPQLPPDRPGREQDDLGRQDGVTRRGR